MRLRKQWLGSGLAAVAVLFTACSEDGSDSILEPSGAMSNVEQAGYIDVWKFGPAGIYSFEASETGTGLYSPTFTVAAGGIATIWTQTDPAAGNSDVTITEVLTPGMQVDSIQVVTFTSDIFTSKITYYNTNTVTMPGANNTSHIIAKVYNSVVPPEDEGSEGCTPGYWRQEQHFDSWTGLAPSDLFADVFGVSYGGTLLEAVWSKGGGDGALARHAVAALLNAASDGVDYPATSAEIIAAVQAAFASGDVETQKNIFEGWNELGCSLN